MGDRGNVVIYQDKAMPCPIVFYSHWGGTWLENDVREAIKSAPGRWTDPSYLARIIFEKITEFDCSEFPVKGFGTIDSMLGFGISTWIGDNEHDLVVVDVPAQRIRRIAEPSNRDLPKHSSLPALELRGVDFTDC
jgi:hypothetical protein